MKLSPGYQSHYSEFHSLEWMECSLTSHNTSNSQTLTSLVETQGSWVLIYLTSNHTSFATRRNSFSDDRCTSQTHLLGWARLMTPQGSWPNKLSQPAGKHRSQPVHPRPQGNEFIHVLKGVFQRRPEVGKTKRRPWGLCFDPMSSHHFSFPFMCPKVKYFFVKKKSTTTNKKDWCWITIYSYSCLTKLLPSSHNFLRVFSPPFPLLYHDTSVII